MVLRPIGSEEQSQHCIPVWDALLPTQKARASEYWLITQADHAALSGAIAAGLGPPLLQRLSSEVVTGIAHHDDGWAPFDAQISLINGRPLSFLDFLPQDFLRAWTSSIDSAEKLSPIAGAIVSRHFCRLGQSRVESRIDGAESCTLLVTFLDCEEERQQRLLGGHSREEFEFLTDVLQFCDVLSLYLCCGAGEDVAFRQVFGGRPICLRREAARTPDQAAVCRFEPSPFAEGGVDLALPARHFPEDRKPSTATLPFLLF